MKHAVLCCLLVLAGAASAQTTLFDTFNEGDQADLFDCCNSLPVGGLTVHDKSKVWLPFTVPIKDRISEIDIPLFYVSGARDQLKVVVQAGQKKKAWFRVSGLRTDGQCCLFVSMTGLSVPVVPGIHYILEVHGLWQTLGGWNLNSAGIMGDYTTWDQDGRHDVNGTLPAVRVIGRW